MSKSIKEDNKKESLKIYQSNRMTKKDIILSGNTKRKPVQIETTYQTQKNNYNLIKTEPKHYQRDTSKNNKQENKITTTEPSRGYSYGKDENKAKNSSSSYKETKNQKFEIVSNSRRNNSKQAKNNQNENINTNNMKNTQKFSSYSVKEIKKENKTNNDTNSNNKNVYNKINQPNTSRRQKNINVSNDNKIEVKRPQSQSKVLIQNYQTQTKYQVKTLPVSQKKYSKYIEPQSQYISKYSSNTLMAKKDSRLQTYKTNTIPIPPKSDIRNIPKPIERRYIPSAIVTNSNKDNSSSKNTSSHNISISNSIYSNSKNDKNKNEINNKKIFTKQNTTTSVRSYSSIKTTGKDNVNISSTANTHNKRNSNSVPKRGEIENNLKTNIQIHSISKTRDNQEKENQKIPDLYVKKTNIVISENRYRRSNKDSVKEGNNNYPLNNIPNRNHYIIDSKDIDKNNKIKISNIITHSNDTSKKKEKEEIIKQSQPRKNDNVKFESITRKTYNIQEVQKNGKKTSIMKKENIDNKDNKILTPNYISNRKHSIQNNSNNNNLKNNQVSNNNKRNVISNKETINLRNNNQEQKNIKNDNIEPRNSRKNNC